MIFSAGNSSLAAREKERRGRQVRGSLIEGSFAQGGSWNPTPLGSWKRRPGRHFLSYQTTAPQTWPHVHVGVFISMQMPELLISPACRWRFSLNINAFRASRCPKVDQKRANDRENVISRKLVKKLVPALTEFDLPRGENTTDFEQEGDEGSFEGHLETWLRISPLSLLMSWYLMLLFQIRDLPRFICAVFHNFEHFAAATFWNAFRICFTRLHRQGGGATSRSEPFPRHVSIRSKSRLRYLLSACRGFLAIYTLQPLSGLL